MRNEQMKNSHVTVPDGEGTKVERSITVAAPVDSVYQFWRRLENLPRFMQHLESVTETDGKHSHWVVKGPIGKRVEWDAEIIEERPNEMISWRSLPGADVDNAGSVWFTPEPRGTTIKVALKYTPPGGKLGAATAKVFGRDAESEIDKDLSQLKQILETGKSFAA